MVLADHTKLGRVSTTHVVPLRAIDTVVTDTGAAPQVIADLQTAGTNVIVAERDTMTSHTEQEILSQPDVWQQTIDALDPMTFTQPFHGGITDVLVTGCGSTHYLALSAAALFCAKPGSVRGPCRRRS